MKKQNSILQQILPKRALITGYQKALALMHLPFLMLGALTLTSSQVGAQTSSLTRDADLAYEHGTNSAMRYLAEYISPLRVTLLLEECGLSSLSKEVARVLPDSVDWFLNGEDAANVPPTDIYFAAQATRAYLLGYEAGVRTEFRQSSPEWKEINCSASALAAKDYVFR